MSTFEPIEKVYICVISLHITLLSYELSTVKKIYRILIIHCHVMAKNDDSWFLEDTSWRKTTRPSLW